MNKKVIALAVAGALALPLAAKAQTANVTMYGSFRLALESIDIENVGRKNSIDSWSSRWGIRGIESLGGGLNGIFQLETGVVLDYPGGVVLDGAAVSNQFITIREAWAGAEWRLRNGQDGRRPTPRRRVRHGPLLLANGTENMNLVSGGVNPAGQFQRLRFCRRSVAPGALQHLHRLRRRYGNSVRYDSPNFSGLTFATQFAFLGENTAGFKCKGWDSMVKYLNGPIELGLGYARHIDFATYDGNAWRLHAGYDARVVKVLGAYERIHLDGNNGSVGKSNTRYYSIGVQVPIGPGTLSAQYGNRDNGATRRQR
jgi:predicted porin